MGRAIGFVQIDDHKQVTETWALLDRKFTYNDGSPQIKVLPASYKYEVKKVLQETKGNFIRYFAALTMLSVVTFAICPDLDARSGVKTR